MKVVRTSHFITKNIAVTPITRPVVAKVPAIPTTEKTIELSIRQQLVKKLNLDTGFCTYKVPTVAKPPKQQVIAKPKISKRKQEQNALNTESRYAAIPRPESSIFLKNLIDLEASVFREIYNGSGEMAISYPSRRR